MSVQKILDLQNKNTIADRVSKEMEYYEIPEVFEKIIESVENHVEDLDDGAHAEDSDRAAQAKARKLERAIELMERAQNILDDVYGG